MVRDSVANLVIRLQESGFDPRRVGADAWEARCPAHLGNDDSLAITRNESSHVVLECRSIESCPHSQIVRALGITDAHLYAETPDWLLSRVSRILIQPASFKSAASASPPVLANSEIESNVVARNQERSGIWAEAPAERLPAAEMGLEPEGLNAEPMLAASPTRGDTAVSEAVSPDGASAAQTSSPASETPARPYPDVESKEFLEVQMILSGGTDYMVERPSPVQVLSRLALSARLFRSADGRLCAQVPVGDRLEIFGLKSAGFRDWLIDAFLSDQPEPPSSWAVRRVVAMLEARARFNPGIPEVFIRVGRGRDGADARCFLDLGDSSGRAVAMGSQGWQVVDRPDVHFRRAEGLLAMPVPDHDGSIDLLRPYVNLAEPDFRLMIAWLTAALRPVGPYPILVLTGEQASGKSTLARIVRLLIDPQACPALALPKSTHDLMATALNGWLLMYENISTIADWLSDGLCQLAFGGGFAGRALFTNDERSVIFAQRPVILVGIDDFVVRGDLRDRSVFLHLAPIPRASRRSERTFWPAFHADYPRILGGVLDAFAGGLCGLPSVDLKELPRMADFAEWGESISRGLGWGTDTFVSTYDDNRRIATEPLLDGSPVANIILALGRAGINWSGTPHELFQALSKTAGKRARAGWPKTVVTFSNELRRIAPQLRLHGISINFERRRDARIITLSSAGDSTNGTSTDPSGS
jgi:hypothetical protein